MHRFVTQESAFSYNQPGVQSGMGSAWRKVVTPWTTPKASGQTTTPKGPRLLPKLGEDSWLWSWR